MHWNTGQCMVNIKKFSSVLRNGLTMNWGEREKGILWPIVLLCGIGIEARVTGQSIKLCSTSSLHKLVLACPVSTHRRVHVPTGTTHEYLKRVWGQREYFFSPVIYIFMGRMPFYILYIAERLMMDSSMGFLPHSWLLSVPSMHWGKYDTLNKRSRGLLFPQRTPGFNGQTASRDISSCRALSYAENMNPHHSRQHLC